MHEYLTSIVSSWPWPALAVAMVVSILALGKGADWLVEDAVKLSLRWGMPRVVVGATIVSLGTTTPEAVVSVMAAFQGRPDMALGNAVGSIICDTGLILGIGCLIAPLPIDPRVANRQGWIQFAAGVLLVALCVPWTSLGATFTSGGTLPQIGGWLLLALLAAYMVWSIRIARTSPDEAGLDQDNKSGTGKIVLSVLAAIAIVVVASFCLITTAEEVAVRLQVPPSIIAATLVAFGTSLPELTIVVTATLKGHGELAIGNVIGADILNVLFVAGAAAAVTPVGLAANVHFFHMQFPAMLFVLIVFRIGIWTAKEGKLRRGFGFVLLGAYLAVTVISYVVSGGEMAGPH
ncbi:MAG: sodium:calcium antiporter [Planctomycetota bacterium]|nr:sodium:calcium antiporter [Planctomycetota bacterium]